MSGESTNSVRKKRRREQSRLNRYFFQYIYWIVQVFAVARYIISFRFVFIFYFFIIIIKFAQLALKIFMKKKKKNIMKNYTVIGRHTSRLNVLYSVLWSTTNTMQRRQQWYLFYCCFQQMIQCALSVQHLCIFILFFLVYKRLCASACDEDEHRT